MLSSDAYVGELIVERTGHGGYLQLRVSLTFEVPDDLPAGDYQVLICDDPCTGSPLGDLVASPLSIGVDPARPVVREWALDDPEIANLAPDAVLVGPGYSTTAAEVRAPRFEPAPAPAPPPAPAAPAAEPTPPAGDDDDMAWPLPTVLVLAAAGGTAVVLRRRWRAMAPAAPPPAAVTGPAAPAGNRTPDAAAAGRG